jgi:hypothetical protein
MGCITSRGENWPPKPFKRFFGGKLRVEIKDNEPPRVEEAYVWVYPGAEIPNGCGDHGGSNWAEEQGPWQEIALRNLEDG